MVFSPDTGLLDIKGHLKKMGDGHLGCQNTTNMSINWNHRTYAVFCERFVLCLWYVIEIIVVVLHGCRARRRMCGAHLPLMAGGGGEEVNISS